MSRFIDKILQIYGEFLLKSVTVWFLWKFSDWWFIPEMKGLIISAAQSRPAEWAESLSPLILFL